MRSLLAAVLVMLVVLIPCSAMAQDEDEAWNEITGLMNAIGGANQQFNRAGAQWMPGSRWAPGMQWLPQTQLVTGATTLTPAEAQALSEFYRWCQMYAQGLQSIEAFGEDGAAYGDPRYWYRPNPRAPAAQRYNRAPRTAPDVLTRYQGGVTLEAGE